MGHWASFVVQKGLEMCRGPCFVFRECVLEAGEGGELSREPGEGRGNDGRLRRLIVATYSSSWWNPETLRRFWRYLEAG